VLVSTKKKLCSECPEMPCRRLKLLDKRYREKYGMSEIENLENIRKWGMAKFIRQEKMRWTCPQCGAVICVHRDHCLKCNAPRVRKRTDQEKA
jgi:ribosomal protein S27AE